MKNWFVYIVRCADGTFYTGISVDIEARVKDHNDGVGAKYTSRRRPVKLIYSEECKNRSEASKREYAIKKLSRKKKLKLILSTRGGIR